MIGHLVIFVSGLLGCVQSNTKKLDVTEPFPIYFILPEGKTQEKTVVFLLFERKKASRGGLSLQRLQILRPFSHHEGNVAALLRQNLKIGSFGVLVSANGMWIPFVKEQ